MRHWDTRQEMGEKGSESGDTVTWDMIYGTGVTGRGTEHGT